MLKLATLCIVAAFVASVSCHGWKKVGFWRQKINGLNCRLTHKKSVLDSRGHVIDCVRRCALNYEESYSWKYGHYCKKLPDGCAGRNCRRCLSGYKQLKMSYRKSRCVKNCPRRYQENNGRCIEKPRGCKNIYCSACLDGYFFYPKPLYFGTKCRTRCPTGYEGNTTTNKCERKQVKEGCVDYSCYRCEDGYYKLNDKSYRNKCVKSCPDGHGPMNRICREIPTGCKTANCSECEDSYFHYDKAVYFQSCRRSCPVGYYEDNESNRCVRCQIDYCSECDTAADMCEKCRGSKALLVNTTTNETSTDCVDKCPKGYRKIYDYEHMMRLCDKIDKKPEPVPEVLPEGCVDNSCLRCKSGYKGLFLDAFGYNCVKECPTGFYDGGKHCLPCTEPGCETCSQGTPTRCVVCKPGYISEPMPLGVKCSSECPKGYVAVTQNETTTCEKEIAPACPITNCETCASHDVHSLHVGCTECEAGYLLKRNIFRDVCVAFCPNGFYASVKPGTKISACLNCGVTFCKSCINRKKCSECYEPFVLDFETGRCTLCKNGTFFNRKTKSCEAVKGFVSELVVQTIN